MKFFLRNRLELILVFVSLIFYVLMLVMFVKFIYLRWPILILPMAVGLVMSPVVSWRKQPIKKREGLSAVFYYAAIGLFVSGFVCVTLPFVLYFSGVNGAGFLGIVGCSVLIAHLVSYFVCMVIIDKGNA